MHELTRKVYEYCESCELITRGAGIVVGVSGGADSVCLLLMLLELSSMYDLKIYPVHVQHGIRGAEAIEDKDFVVQLCRQQGLEAIVYDYDIPRIAKEEGLTLEEAGRIRRYEAFEEVRREKTADLIAVAHHLNDQAETILFNLMRGTGIKGLGGISSRRDKIIRPLLNVSREEIEAFLHDMNQLYRIDSTNADLDYSRNIVRNCLLPKMNEVVNNSTVHICSTALELREIDLYMHRVAAKAEDEVLYVDDCNNIRILVDKLTALDVSIQKYVIRNACNRLLFSLKDIGRVHIYNILSLTGLQSGRKISLPYFMEAIRIGNEIVLSKSHNKENIVDITHVDFEGNYELWNGDTVSTLVLDYNKCEAIPNEVYTKWFDCDKISDGLLMRTRQSGDYLYLNSAGSKKSLKKYFIDEKIPLDVRNELPVLADGSHVLWVIGKRISDYYKVSDSTKRVLIVEYKKAGKYGR